MAADLPAASAAFERLGKVASLRADLFQLLAIGFYDPSPLLAEALAEGSFQADVNDTLQGLGEGLALSGASAAHLSRASEELLRVDFGTDGEALYHELAVEYARLFIGMPSPAVSPYESIHVDSDPESRALLMVGPASRAVLATYREAGLDMASGLNEPPDHIATELEFAYFLCAKEALAWEAGDNAEARKWRRLESAFAEEHLASWGVDFARRVAEATTNAFYSALAKIAEAYFDLESDTGRA